MSEHYAIVRCACGEEAPDSGSDQEAAEWIVKHVVNQCDHLWQITYTGYEGARVAFTCHKCEATGYAANVLPIAPEDVRLDHSFAPPVAPEGEK